MAHRGGYALQHVGKENPSADCVQSSRKHTIYQSDKECIIKRVRVTESFSDGGLLFARIDWGRHCYGTGLLNKDARIQTK